MSKLKNKIDFAALLSVTMANPNGDRSTATARASIWTATARFPTYASSASCAIVCRIWEKRCSFSLPTAATTAAAASANVHRGYSKNWERRKQRKSLRGSGL